MPIYEYECNECHEILEVSQSISEDPKTTCPSCTGQLKKLISRSSFQLKGGGWYSDGYSSTSTSSKPAPKSSTSDKPACPKSAGASCPCQ